MDTAFEKARAAYGTGAYDDATLEFIFPELKESEDEQIRKAIIKSLDMPFPEDNLPGTDVTYKEAVDWLEKQNHDGKKWITPAELNRLETLRYEAGFDDGVRSEMKKQKDPIPIPDKFSGLKSLMLQYLKSAANRKDDAEIESDTDLWGRKILDYVWKYNEKQKEQKPAEWSEEDEDMLNSCISSIEEAKENRCAYKETDGDTSYDHEIAWLKSLRPSWKPSEEQLEAARYVSQFNYGGYKAVLVSLYEQLKQL